MVKEVILLCRCEIIELCWHYADNWNGSWRYLLLRPTSEQISWDEL